MKKIVSVVLALSAVLGSMFTVSAAQGDAGALGTYRVITFKDDMVKEITKGTDFDGFGNVVIKSDNYEYGRTSPYCKMYVADGTAEATSKYAILKFASGKQIEHSEYEKYQYISFWAYAEGNWDFKLLLKYGDASGGKDLAAMENIAVKNSQDGTGWQKYSYKIPWNGEHTEAMTGFSFSITKIEGGASVNSGKSLYIDDIMLSEKDPMAYDYLNLPPEVQKTDGGYSVAGTIMSNKAETVTGKYIVAAFDGEGNLKEAQAKPLDSFKGNNDMDTGSGKVEPMTFNTEEDGWTFKAFLWKDLGGMEPLANAAEGKAN